MVSKSSTKPPKQKTNLPRPMKKTKHQQKSKTKTNKRPKLTPPQLTPKQKPPSNQASKANKALHQTEGKTNLINGL